MNPQPKFSDFVTSREIEKSTGANFRDVKRWAEAGHIRSIKVPDRPARYNLQDALDLIARSIVDAREAARQIRINDIARALLEYEAGDPADNFYANVSNIDLETA